MSELRVEAEGETVGEAKWAALRELARRQPGLDKASVRFEVVTEGQRGLLGVGYAPARVVATADEPEREPTDLPAAPVDVADPGDRGARAREVVQRIVAGLGVRRGRERAR